MLCKYRGLTVNQTRRTTAPKWPKEAVAVGRVMHKPGMYCKTGRPAGIRQAYHIRTRSMDRQALRGLTYIGATEMVDAQKQKSGHPSIHF